MSIWSNFWALLIYLGIFTFLLELFFIIIFIIRYKTTGKKVKKRTARIDRRGNNAIMYFKQLIELALVYI